MDSLPIITLQCLQQLNEVYDISAPLHRSPAYPGDREYIQEWLAGAKDSDETSLSALSMSTHASTHLDFPRHIAPSGRSQESYPPGRFIMPAEVVCIPGSGPVMPSCLHGCRAGKGQALLFKTENSRRNLMHEPFFNRDYVFLSPDAARHCVSRGLSLVGIDYLSIDCFEDESLPAHHILLENDTLILEGLDLSRVPEGRYLLICLPLSIENAEASPVRAVMVR